MLFEYFIFVLMCRSASYALPHSPSYPIDVELYDETSSFHQSLKLMNRLKSETDQRLGALEHDMAKVVEELETVASALAEDKEPSLYTADSVKKDILEEPSEIQDLQEIDYSCKKLEIYGYNYEKFYTIDNETFHNTKLQKDENGITFFEMQFGVKAFKDGIVMLSSTQNPDYGVSVFEIVIGQGNGNYTELRRSKDNDGVLLVETPNILSPSQFIHFYIRIVDGHLEVGQAGQPAFLSYKHDDLRLVKYISFTTWGSKMATFLFDCPE